MENLKLFYPLILLALFFFLDARGRRKRQAPPQQPDAGAQQAPQERQEDGEYASTAAEQRAAELDDDDAVPWYVEFPEDRPKSQPTATERVYQAPPEPALATAAAVDAAVSEPLYKRFAAEPQPVLAGLGSKQTVAVAVRRGLIMSVILDKPRSLKPYDDSL